MRTPPPTPPRTPKRPLETPKSMGGNSPGRGSTSCVLFTDETPTKRTCNGDQSSEDGVPGTPPSGRFSLIGLLSPGRREVPGILSGPPPRAPSKLMKIKSGPESLALEGLVILTILWKWIADLGTGSFGTVDEVAFQPPTGSPPGTPCSPPVAMKIAMQSDRQGPKALLAEAANVGSPGCASGVATTCKEGHLYLFTSVAIPLTKMYQIGATFLEEVIRLTKEAIMKAPLPVVFDCKPDNLGFVPSGTTTVVADENGQPCAGPPTDANSVVFLDLGNCRSPEEADKDFNPLLDNEAVETKEQQANFRKFKCEMMEALLRNQFADSPEDENRIVADLCTKKGWCCACSPQYQPDFQE